MSAGSIWPDWTQRKGQIMNKRHRTAAGRPLLHTLIALTLLPVGAVTMAAPAHAGTAFGVQAAADPTWSEWAAFPTEYMTREQAVRAVRQAYQYVSEVLQEQNLEIRVGELLVEAATGFIIRFRIEWRKRLT